MKWILMPVLWLGGILVIKTMGPIPLILVSLLIAYWIWSDMHS